MNFSIFSSKLVTAATAVVFALVIMPTTVSATTLGDTIPVLETPSLTAPSLTTVSPTTLGDTIPVLETPGLTAPSLTTASLQIEPVTCTMSVNQQEIVAGGSVTIEWETNGAETITINGETVTNNSGQMTISDIFVNTTFELVAKNNKGGTCQANVQVTCIPPEIPVRCEDFGYDFEIGKYEWNGHAYQKESLMSEYSVSVTGDDHSAQWTADPAVAGVIVKAATTVENFAGGTSGSVNKSDIGSGKHGISNVAFCGKETPKICELTLNKSVDKTHAKTGEILTYTISIENTGTRDCTGGGVKIFDTVDENLEYLEYSATANLSPGYGGKLVYTESDRTLRWNGHVLKPGETGEITWTGKVKTPHTCGDFDVLNGAKATAKELNNFNDWSYSNQVTTAIDYDCTVDCTPGSQYYNPGTDLTGYIFDGQKGKVTNNSEYCSYPVGLASYEKFDEIIDNQLIFDYETDTVGPKEMVELHVDVPQCAYQIDLFYGDVLLSLDGERYGDRKLDWKHLASDKGYCDVVEEPKEATVVAHKIVCTNEDELPNWGTGGPNITANTAADWVANNPSCSFKAGWEFQWADTSVSNPDIDVVNNPFYGKAGSAWTTFGLTDANGRVSTQIPASVIKDNSFLWMREVLQDDYIPFTYGPGNQTNADNVSAEMYCHTDVQNFDNFDRVDGLEGDKTYHCVAWNAKIPSDVLPSCDAFTANPTTIRLGQSLTLSWETTNTVQVFINNGVGNVPVDGSVEVSPLEDTTYVLTAIGTEDKTDDCHVSVKVDDTPDRPMCPFTPGPNVTVIEFDEKLRSDISLGNSQTKIELADFDAGTYNISLASWDGYYSRINVTQPNEQWQLEFLSGTTQVGISAAIGDLQDRVRSAYLQERVNDKYVLTSPADGVRAVHAFYPDAGSPNSVDPICAEIEKVQEPAPSCDAFTASPNNIIVGSTSTLAWETSNVTRVEIDNGIGEVDEDGSLEVTPETDTTYILTVFGTDDRSVTCEVPVMVSEDPVPVCEVFTANPTNLPVGGGAVELNWTVEDATSVSIQPTVGTVGLNGSTSVDVTESTTFTLTAIDTNGDEVSCVAPVSVPDPVLFTCADNVSFGASPNSVRRGADVTLTWNVTDADTVSISGISATTFSGSEVVNPSNDTTYVLTATLGSETIECPTNVTVSTGGGGGGSSSPRCELDISDERISLGDEIILTWDTSRANDVKLVDDLGNVIFDTNEMLSSEKDDYEDGSITLAPTRDTEYTLTAERGSRDRTCRVSVELEDDIVVLQTRDQQPLVAGISLSSVPYTGFEAGPFMTIMFYALLIAWAFYIAYLVVIRKQMTTTSLNHDVTPQSVVNMQSAEARRPDVFVQTVVTPTESEKTAAPANLPGEDVHVGYDAHQVSETTVADIEDRAHAQKALLSSDAIRHFVATTEGSVERHESLDSVISEAKDAYPLEDGWIVINESRMKNLCEVCKVNAEKTPETFTPSVVPTGSSSLAEAIVTGNVVAAYEMIGHRPMFALADAAADLDAVYRNRRGDTKVVSDMLTNETESLTDEQITNMISALTSALDGTYTSEAEAVKMAIMKAVKEVA